VLTLLQLLQQRENARQHAAVVATETLRQASEIGSVQFVVILLAVVDLVQPQQIARDRAIGAAAVRNLYAQGDAKDFREGGFQGSLAGAAAGQERSVDVEKASDHEGHCIEKKLGSAGTPQAARGIALFMTRPFLLLSQLHREGIRLPKRDHGMSIAIVQRSLSASPTWRQFQTACACVVLAIGVGCALYGVETLALHCQHRFVENPSDTMTRAVGIAHFSIGWLFLFTSPRLRNRAALGRLTFWTFFGIAFCAVFAWGGADKNPLLLLAFYSFFFIHEACDEAYLFRTSGELPAQTPEVDRFLRSLCLSISLSFITLLAGLQILRGHLQERSVMMRDIPSVYLYAGLLVVALLSAGAVVGTIRRARSTYGSLLDTVSLYQPLLMVYAGLLAILLVGSVFGSVGANLVILLHGMTWLVCTHRKLGERNFEVKGLWSWLRNSAVGFLTLHLIVSALALLLFALRTHVWQRTGLICDLVSKTWFPYWGIMHIAMSFWRTR
jgi:hypothetical protein